MIENPLCFLLHFPFIWLIISWESPNTLSFFISRFRACLFETGDAGFVLCDLIVRTRASLKRKHERHPGTKGCPLGRFLSSLPYRRNTWFKRRRLRRTFLLLPDK